MAEEFTRNINRSMIRQVRIGDLVELLGDEKFFKGIKEEGSPLERYTGYVVSLDKFVMGLSPSHPNNTYHGYVGGNSKQEQKVTLINADYIAEYRIASATDKD